MRQVVYYTTVAVTTAGAVFLTYIIVVYANVAPNKEHKEATKVSEMESQSPKIEPKSRPVASPISSSSDSRPPPASMKSKPKKRQ